MLKRRVEEIFKKKGQYNQTILRPKSDYPAFRRTYFNYKYQDIEKMKTILEYNIMYQYRINNVKPYYKTKDINEEAKKQEEYLNNILAKNRMIKIPPPLNYYDIEQYKNLVEAQNEEENQDENIIEEDEREGDEEEEGEEKKKKKEEKDNKDKKEENQKKVSNEEEKKEKKDENKNKEEEPKKNNNSTTNNSTREKKNAH